MRAARTLSQLKSELGLKRDNRASAAKRGYGRRWQKKRDRFLKKNPLCAECLKEGIIEVATTVDHIEPHKGDMELFWDEENWQSLCTPHHNKKTAKYDGGFGNVSRVGGVQSLQTGGV